MVISYGDYVEQRGDIRRTSKPSRETAEGSGSIQVGGTAEHWAEPGYQLVSS